MSDPDNSLGGNLKRAFLWHWHLLALGSSVAFLGMNGMLGRLAPIVIAGELAYLFFLGINPRFQRVLKGGALQSGLAGYKPSRTKGTANPDKLIAFLSPHDRSRFDSLRDRCARLMELRQSMEAGTPEAGKFRSESLDRMLWLYLRLLHQRSGLERFLQTTQRRHIEDELNTAEKQLQVALTREPNRVEGIETPLVLSIRDRMNTIQGRLENHERASEALELLASEIERSEQQITHLCEVGMTLRDSAGLTARIEILSSSLQSSERLFADTEIDSLFEDEGFAPPLLSRSSSQMSPVTKKKITN